MAAMYESFLVVHLISLFLLAGVTFAALAAPDTELDLLYVTPLFVELKSKFPDLSLELMTDTNVRLVRGEPRPAKVVALPFVPHRYHRG